MRLACVFVSMIFNKGAYLTKPIFHKALKDGIFAIWESREFGKSQYFPFQWWVPNKGTTGTIFITSMVWRGLYQGLNPGPPALEASTLLLGYW